MPAAFPSYAVKRFMNPLPADAPDHRDAAAVEFVCRRNCSIGPRPLLLVFASLAALSFGFGAAFAALGPWMVLPFAGVEMLALGAAFLVCGRSAGSYERVRVAADAVVVEVFERESVIRREFNPRWARVRVLRGPQSVRIVLSEAGREFELGRHLGFERRLAFAAEFEAAFRMAARA